MKLSGLMRRRDGSSANSNNSRGSKKQNNPSKAFAQQQQQQHQQVFGSSQQQQQQYQQQYQQQRSSGSAPSDLVSSSVSSSSSSMMIDDLTGPLNFSIDRTTSYHAPQSSYAAESCLEPLEEDDDVSMHSAGNSSQFSMEEDGDASMSVTSSNYTGPGTALSSTRSASSSRHFKQRRAVQFQRTVTIHDMGHAYTNNLPLAQVQLLQAQEKPPLTPQDIQSRWYTRDECSAFKKHMLKSVKSIRKIEDLFKAKGRTSYMMNMQALYEECDQLPQVSPYHQLQQHEEDDMQDYVPLRADWFNTLKDVGGNVHTIGLEKFAINNMHQNIIHARRQLYSKIRHLQKQHGLVDSTAAMSLQQSHSSKRQQQQQLACNPQLERELARLSRQMTRSNRMFYTYLAQIKAVAQEGGDESTVSSASMDSRSSKRGKR